jgi:hypothetical protein
VAYTRGARQARIKEDHRYLKAKHNGILQGHCGVKPLNDVLDHKDAQSRSIAEHPTPLHAAVTFGTRFQNVFSFGFLLIKGDSSLPFSLVHLPPVWSDWV